MIIALDFEQLHIEFEIDGTENSTLDWEMPSYSMKGYKNKTKSAK